MDYISVSSEIIESWDFTQAPVRGLREVYGERSIDDIFQYSDIIWSKGVRKKLSRRKEPFRHRKIVESSTSLILKKTIDRKVVNDYSASSFSDIILPHNPVYRGSHTKAFTEYRGSDGKYPVVADGKPLIKVTVIPHNPPHFYDEGYTTRPRRHITIPQNPIEKNPSDPYDTKNFYLVVAGCKNRKIYELNTRSGKGETCKHEALLNENEYKQYFNANMIKNKRKLTNKNDNLAPEGVPETCTHNCRCHGCHQRSSQELKTRSNGNNRNGTKIKKSHGKNDSDSYRMEVPNVSGKNSGSNRSRTEIAITTARKGVADVSAPKSRIKITGRLGLTAEDKYVLKCDATLDDKPIATHFQSAGQDDELRRPSVVWNSSIEAQRPPKQQRDSSIQTETRFIPCLKYDPLPTKQRDFNIQTDRFIHCSAFNSTFQCQATQINFDRPRHSRAVCNDDKTVQCCCATNIQKSTCTSDNSDISLKPCPSPIVIISVYPNQESTEIVTKNKGFSPEDKYTTQIEYGQKGKQKLSNKTKTVKAAARSRSPSPAKVSKKDKETQIKSTITSSKQVYDSKSKAGRKKTKTRNVQTVNLTKSSNMSKKSEQRSKSPSRVSSPGRRKDSPKSKLNSNLSTGTNTHNMLTKKALVDDFTKQIALMNHEKSKAGFMRKAKHNNSNVTINIDGDNERYNVTFRQGDLDRDLSVRKTHNGIMSKHPEIEEHTSLENFLTLRPDEPRKRTHSQTIFLAGNNLEADRSSSKLNVVDSLEISRRREERTSIVGGKTTQTVVKNDKNTCNAVDNEFLAPIKHFHGDECLITDPIERDLEIRALLGIDKGRFKPPERPNSSKASDPLGIGNGDSLHYIYQQPHPSQSEAKKSAPKNKILVSENVKQDATNGAPEKKASLYQQLVLSKNFQVLLELKQTKKEKPIVLTHQQFEKVRKTICHVLVNSSSGSRHTRMSSLKCSVVSLRKIRTKPKENLVYHYNKEAQTEAVGVSFSMIQTDAVLGKVDFDLSSKADNEEVMRLINDFTKRDDFSSSDVCEPTPKMVDVGSSTDDSKQIIDRRESVPSVHHAHKDSKSLSILEQTETRILINSSQSTYYLKPKPVKQYETEFPKRAASSLEVHYASTSYIRHVKFSSSDNGGDSNPVTNKNLEVKESASIHTLFNGHRRTYTPNLGASAYSLCADGGSDCFDTRVQCFDEVIELNLKPKKPFLRRLISCLVLRASRASNTKLLPGPVLNQPSINSSLDSYHINTSLGAVEMSSSIYDTTASFYSNHTILPARRMRRGFFCSVRGFLSRS